MKVFTIGYQGVGLDLYISALLQANVNIVIDVRERAFSHNRIYIGSVMKKALARVQIDYVHLKACGNPSENRRTAKGIKECLSRYREYLAENEQCLAELFLHLTRACMDGKLACLTCFEHLASECHRSVLLDALMNLEPDIEVLHLSPSRIVEAPIVLDTKVPRQKMQSDAL